VYVKVRAELESLYHKLWEYGIFDVGKPLVLNLKASVEGTSSGEFQSVFKSQGVVIKLLIVENE